MGSDGAAATKQISVVVRFVGSPDALRGRGLELRTIAGDIGIATVQLRDVAWVASDPHITFIELSRTLTPDRE